jgi:hypothetical protein
MAKNKEGKKLKIYDIATYIKEELGCTGVDTGTHNEIKGFYNKKFSDLSRKSQAFLTSLKEKGILTFKEGKESVEFNLPVKDKVLTSIKAAVDSAVEKIQEQTDITKEFLSLLELNKSNEYKDIQIDYDRIIIKSVPTNLCGANPSGLPMIISNCLRDAGIIELTYTDIPYYYNNKNITIEVKNLRDIIDHTTQIKANFANATDLAFGLNSSLKLNSSSGHSTFYDKGITVRIPLITGGRKAEILNSPTSQEGLVLSKLKELGIIDYKSTKSNYSEECDIFYKGVEGQLASLSADQLKDLKRKLKTPLLNGVNKYTNVLTNLRDAAKEEFTLRGSQADSKLFTILNDVSKRNALIASLKNDSKSEISSNFNIIISHHNDGDIKLSARTARLLKNTLMQAEAQTSDRGFLGNTWAMISQIGISVLNLTSYILPASYKAWINPISTDSFAEDLKQIAFKENTALREPAENYNKKNMAQAEVQGVTPGKQEVETIENAPVNPSRKFSKSRSYSDLAFLSKEQVQTNHLG